MFADPPQLQAITILLRLHEDHLEEYPDSTCRKLKRRVRHWRAMSGTSKAVFLPQLREPDSRDLPDLTATADLRVSMANVPFKHLQYHFVLALARWEYVNVVEGGESFEALSMGR